MKKVETRTVALKDLEINLYVRRVLNQDHALFLAELLDNGTKLPPIKVALVDEKYIVIDGRHRIEAHELCKLTEIRVEICQVRDQAELIAEAYRSNVGGPLPPTAEDTEHTIVQLLDGGTTQRDIIKLLRLPAGMARRYIKSVQSKMTRSKIQKAADAITEGGLTVAKAAEQYGIEPEKLKQSLSGHRRRHKQGVAEIQSGLTKLYKSLSLRNAALLRNLLEKLEDADVTSRQVTEIFDHLESLQKKSARSVADWKKRFETASGNGAPAKRLAVAS